MEIKTLGDFRKATQYLEDDFKLEVNFFEELTEEELKDMIYPYPWECTEGNLELNDIGYSDRIIYLGLYKK